MSALLSLTGNLGNKPQQAGEVVWFTPGLHAPDVYTAYWIRQAVLRLRRELCWAWRHSQTPDPLTDALDRTRLHEQRLEFFERDETARHLTQAISQEPPAVPDPCARGTFPWLAGEPAGGLGLLPAEIFTTALVLMHSWDAAAAEVIGAAQGDGRRSLPTLGLVQRLWDEPGALSSLTSFSHPLFRLGLIRADAQDAIDWRTPLTMPALVAQRLLAAADRPSAAFTVVRGGGQPAKLPVAANLVALRACEPVTAPHAVPLRAASSMALATDAGIQGLLESFSAITGRPVYMWNPSRSGAEVQTAAALCWLDGADLYLQLAPREAQEATSPPFTGIPIYVLAFWDQEKLQIPGWHMLPPIDLPALDLPERLDCWQRSFPEGTAPPDGVLEDCAFRFRFDRAVIQEIARTLARAPGPVTSEKLVAACRQRADAAPGNLAVRVKPRFKADELILPPAQQRQFDELVTALQTLSRVHARWGTGRVWDEAGISALFAGPPGTGKTTAAEVLAARLGLPMFRVDLSQVVNKYIGETEKNLRRLFDSMEECDSLLFFDEAEALFGQRIQARNANDRFANMEVSYLLQRMERFRGVAILATNRRKDLDEAFLRRLRFVLEFPLPDALERKRIWESGIPAEVDGSGLDLEFLSRQFALSGGHIRSIILHACLQSAGQSSERVLSMETVMLSVKREYQKLDRTLTREQCGKWSGMLEER
jgi:adenylate kinase family enzyme